MNNMFVDTYPFHFSCGSVGYLLPPSLGFMPRFMYELDMILYLCRIRRYPQQLDLYPSIQEYYRSHKDVIDRDQWPVHTVPKDEPMSIEKYVTDHLDLWIDKLLQRTIIWDVDREKISARDKFFLCVSGGESVKIPIQGKTETFDAFTLSAFETIIGRSLPEFIPEGDPATLVEAPKPPQLDHTLVPRTLAQLLNCFEGTSPEEWLKMPWVTISALLEESNSIREKIREDMDAEKDKKSGSGSAEGLTPYQSEPVPIDAISLNKELDLTAIWQGFDIDPPGGLN